MKASLIIVVITLVAAVVTVVAIAHWRRLARYNNLRLANIKPSIESLLRRGYDGAVLWIREMDSDRFVQFAKYILENGEYGIWLGFPRAPWSQPYYDKLREELRRADFELETQETGEKVVSEFTLVDCGADVERAMQLVEIVFVRVFGSGPAVRLSVRAQDVSPREEVVRDRSRKPGDV